MNEFQIVLRSMNAAPFAEVKKAYAVRAMAERDRIEFVNSAMSRAGFELVQPGDGAIADGRAMTDDGREITWACGKAWTLKYEIHKQRLDEAFRREKDNPVAAHQQPSAHTSPAVCTSLIDGQLCGGTLIRAAVCPRCALGKSGVAATLTCDVCGHVTAIMRGEV